MLVICNLRNTLQAKSQLKCNVYNGLKVDVNIT